MRSVIGLLCVLALVAFFAPSVRAVGSYSRTASYHNEIVLRCPDKNKATVKVLEAHSDVWNIGKESIDLRINKKAFARVQRYFPECRVIVANVETYMQEAEIQMFPVRRAEEQAWVQEVIKESIPKCNLRGCEKALLEWEHAFQQSNTWFQEYHDYDAIRGYYKNLAGKHPKLVTYIPSIGTTHEGRDMPAVHITASAQPDRKRFYMQCQIHAREWITGSVCMYVANHLATNYGKIADVTYLLNNLEFVMIPIVNPDGIVYTWKHDRLWRKNRMKHNGDSCYGVDINRNFKLGFLHKGNSKSCAEDYGGPNPLSEKESQTIVKYFRMNAPIIGAIDWHSYGQLLLRPYGYTNASSPDEAFLATLTKEMADKIYAVNGMKYTPERSEELYPCYGIAADWLYSNDAARTNKGYRAASVCIELRDKSGHYGFVLPADQILDTAKEVLPAVIHYAKAMLGQPLKFNKVSQAMQPKFDERKIPGYSSFSQ